MAALAIAGLTAVVLFEANGRLRRGGVPDAVNGRASVTPPRFLHIVRLAASFPDRSSVEVLRGLGVRSVALHVASLDATPSMAWRSRSIEGLGIRRSILGDLVVYDLRPRAR